MIASPVRACLGSIFVFVTNETLLLAADAIFAVVHTLACTTHSIRTRAERRVDPRLPQNPLPGDVKLEATVQDIPEGPYTATCRLIKGDAIEDISHSVHFLVGYVPDGPSGDEHLCPA